MAKIVKVCPICGKEFKTTKARIAEGRGKYCSKECYWTSIKKTDFKKCPVCGKDVKRLRGIYCSRECSNKHLIKDLTGKKFNNLTVIKMVGKSKRGAEWLCKCDCGNETILSSNLITKGYVKSCGCLLHENKHTKTHELSKTRLYKIWSAIKRRCFNKNCKDYKDYGGRGITICLEWKNDFVSFYNWANENDYKEGLSIDRINTNGNYEPSNCRWATQLEQQNNKRSNVFIEYKGEIHTIADWSRIMEIKASVLYNRLKKGWTFEKAITIPTKTKN